MADPTAQGTDTETTSGNETEQQNEANPFAGIQKRIDELTAKNHEQSRYYQEQLAKRDEQITNLMAQMLERSGAVQSVQEEEIEVDPNVEKYLQRMQKKIADQFSPILQRQTAMLQQMEYQQLANDYEPDVQKLANDLMRQWRQQGKSGWEMKDALTFASGALGKPAKSVVQRGAGSQQRGENGQFAGNVSHPLDGHAAPPVAAVKKSKRPANFDSLPPEKQFEILSAELGDVPI